MLRNISKASPKIDHPLCIVMNARVQRYSFAVATSKFEDIEVIPFLSFISCSFLYQFSIATWPSNIWSTGTTTLQLALYNPLPTFFHAKHPLCHSDLRPRK